MIFSPELAAEITLGRKSVTRRRRQDGVPCRYVVGRTYGVQLHRGGCSVDRVRILSVSESTPGDVDAAEARREGFPDVRSFQAYWTKVYGSFDWRAPVWRIEFELVEGER